MRILDQDTDKGDGLCNEDRAGAAGGLAWIVDGATSLSDSTALPASTDAEWLADYVDRYFRERFGAVSSASVRDIFSDLAAAIGRSLDELGMSGDVIPPVCSCGLAVRRDGKLELALVGDVSLYVVEQDALLEDPSFRQREAVATRGRPTVGGDGGLSADSRRSIAGRRRKYITGGLGSYVLSRNPGVREGVRTMTLDARDTVTVLLATDGFARLVDAYRLFDSWQELAASVARSGISQHIKMLRVHEENTRSSGHYKARDDACALLLEI